MTFKINSAPNEYVKFIYPALQRVYNFRGPYFYKLCTSMTYARLTFEISASTHAVQLSKFVLFIVRIAIISHSFQMEAKFVYFKSRAPKLSPNGVGHCNYCMTHSAIFIAHFSLAPGVRFIRAGTRAHRPMGCLYAPIFGLHTAGIKGQ